MAAVASWRASATSANPNMAKPRAKDGAEASWESVSNLWVATSSRPSAKALAAMSTAGQEEKSESSDISACVMTAITEVMIRTFRMCDRVAGLGRCFVMGHNSPIKLLVQHFSKPPRACHWQAEQQSLLRLTPLWFYIESAFNTSVKIAQNVVCSPNIIHE
ncbi:hypothetical protein ES703_69677 [subsurface metagenome]